MSSLQDAREAINQGDTTTAQAIIADVLKGDQGNAEAWFLLSEAVDGDRKLIFLNKAIKLDPTLDEAIQRKAELEGTAVVEPEPEPELEPIPEIELESSDDFGLDTITPADFESFGQFEDEEDAAQVEEPKPLKTDIVDVAPTIKNPPPTAVGTTQTKPKNQKEENIKEQSSSPINTIGLGISVLLTVLLFILFVQSLLNNF
ncbi:MAG: hypothetical protein KDE51_19725 [Anaerolineales bacterium]|nr:hypothetical protein [Anaerolineales bacterium]